MSNALVGPFSPLLRGSTRWQIVQGDCLRVLPALPDGAADVVAADPPYGISYAGRPGIRIANDRAPFIWWLWEAQRVLREGGSLVCFCRWDVQEAFRLAITWAGLRVRSQVIWDKGCGGQGDCAAQFSPQHEIALFAPVELLERLLRAVVPENGLVVDPCAGSASMGEAALRCGLRYLGIEVDDGYVSAGRARLRQAA